MKKSGQPKMTTSPPPIQRITEMPTPNQERTPLSVERVLTSSGQPLEPTLRQEMESSLGHDFSKVRLHLHSDATASAKDISAKAYTAGNSIVFDQQYYNPSRSEGRRLIAHELTHVIQQSQADRRDDTIPDQLKNHSGSEAISASTQSSIIQKQTNEKNSEDSHEQAGDKEPLIRTDVIAKFRNYEHLAQIIHGAIYKVGTDEEAVYQALAELNREQQAINNLISVYAKIYPGCNLIEDIKDDFSGSELEYALQLINIGDPHSLQRINSADDSEQGLLHAAKRLNDAFEIFLGTDEEAVYATLLPFNRDSGKLQRLRSAYQQQYHESLIERIFDEFSDSELDYALYLFLTPQEAYQYYLKQASRGLSDFLKGGKSIGEGILESKEQKNSSGYDDSFWLPANPINDQGDSQKLALRLLPSKKPSEAVQKMFISMSQKGIRSYFSVWKADCGEWVQVHHLYAMLQVLGPYRFDERFGGGQEFWFKSHRSTGIKAGKLYFRSSANEKLKPALINKGEPKFKNDNDATPLIDNSLPERDPDELLREAPIGSRIGWFNAAIMHPEIGGKIPTKEAEGFANENSIKIGPNLFSAHGFPPSFTSASPRLKEHELTRRELALRSLDYGSNPRLSLEENIQRTVFIGEIEIYQTLENEPWNP